MLYMWLISEISSDLGEIQYFMLTLILTVYVRQDIELTFKQKIYTFQFILRNLETMFGSGWSVVGIHSFLLSDT